MKCPKCHYLSFDPEPRCRNCGYDLELSDDLALKTAADAVEGPLVDLALRDNDAPKRAPITLELVHPARPITSELRIAAAGVALAERDEPRPAAVVPAQAAAPAPPPVAPGRSAPVAPSAQPTVTAVAPPPQQEPAPRADAPARRPSTTSELPLFVQGLVAREAAGDRPMVVVPPAPRAPLAVRRAAPEAPRSQAGSVARKPGPFDRDLLDDLRRLEIEHARGTCDTEANEAMPPGAPSRPAHDAATARAEAVGRVHAWLPAEEDAPIVMRLGAAAIDAGLLAGIGLVVLLSTLRLCGLSTNQISEVPLLPIAAFLLIVTVGYLLLFTIAAGQTVGKMVLGLRVTGAHDGALTIRQAAYRELLSVPSVVVLGAGFLPAVVGRGQALHDQIAETRVVRT
jgi:uncharacterized RDD family membrane protein YckC